MSMDLFDFGDGNGPVPAHRHVMAIKGLPKTVRSDAKGLFLNSAESNDNIVLGGWVANSARVAPGVLLGVNAVVFGEAQVEGEVWILNDARIYGQAQVSENAWVSDYAEVYGCAKLCGRVEVKGHATVRGFARVLDNAYIGGNAVVEDWAVVGGDAVLRGRVQIGGHVIIGGGVRLEEDEVLEAGIQGNIGFSKLLQSIYAEEHAKNVAALDSHIG